MVCAIGCRCVACGPVWTQMVVDAGQGKEIRKKKEKKKKRNLLGTDGWRTRLRADALHAHGLWLQIRVLRKEKKLTSADGGRNCMRTRCVAWAVDCVCAWAVDTDEGDEKRKKKNDRVRILDVISCRRGCVACGRRWWWARTGVKK